jgi:predicted RNase H-like HicB family nuclease
MASAGRLAYHLLVGPVNPAHGGGCLALVPGLSGWMNDGHSPEDVAANGEDAIDVGIEAANDLDGPRQGIPDPARRLVLDAAQ